MTPREYCIHVEHERPLARDERRRPAAVEQPVVGDVVQSVDARVTVAEQQHGLAGRAQPAQLALQIVDPEADVVQPVAVLREPRRERMGRVERLNELQVGVAEVEIGQPHRHLRRLVHGDHLQAEMVAEVAQRRLGVGDGHGDMVEPADHRGSAVAGTRGPIAATTSARRSSPPTFPGTIT